MELVPYIVRSAAGTRIAGYINEEQANRSLLPGEVATLATPKDIAEHHQRVKDLISTARAQAAASAEPSEADVLLEALKTKHAITEAELDAARNKLKGAKGYFT